MTVHTALYIRDTGDYYAAFPIKTGATVRSLADWLSYRIVAIEAADPNLGRYTFSLDDDNGTEWYIFPITSLTFTADSGTDTFTSASHGFANGDKVSVSATTTLPTGLSAATIYYIISITTNTFQLSTTLGGSAVNITSNGTGTLTIQSLPGNWNLADDIIDLSDTITRDAAIRTPRCADEIVAGAATKRTLNGSADYIEETLEVV
jgi:hypothetical protein